MNRSNHVKEINCNLDLFWGVFFPTVQVKCTRTFSFYSLISSTDSWSRLKSLFLYVFIFLLFVLFVFCFTPHSRIFHLKDHAQHYVDRKLGSARGKPTTFRGYMDLHSLQSQDWDFRVIALRWRANRLMMASISVQWYRGHAFQNKQGSDLCNSLLSLLNVSIKL